MAAIVAVSAVTPPAAMASGNPILNRPEWLKKVLTFLDLETSDKLSKFVGDALKGALASYIGDAAFEAIGLKKSLGKQLSELRKGIVDDVLLGVSSLRNDEKLGDVDSLMIRWIELTTAESNLELLRLDYSNWMADSQKPLSTMEQFFRRADPLNKGDMAGITHLAGAYATLSAARVMALTMRKEFFGAGYDPDVIRDAIKRGAETAYLLVGAQRGYLDNGVQTRVQTFRESKFWQMPDVGQRTITVRSPEFFCELNGVWSSLTIDVSCKGGCPSSPNYWHTYGESRWAGRNTRCRIDGTWRTPQPVSTSGEIPYFQIVPAVAKAVRNKIDFQFEDRFSAEPGVKALRNLLNVSSALKFKLPDPARGAVVIGNPFFETIGQSTISGSMKADATVYRPGDGNWFMFPHWGAAPYAIGWGGAASDIPVSGDYDGDGVTDLVVYRDGQWHIRSSEGPGTLLMVYGNAGDVVLSGDYDGDGIRDAAIYRPNLREWHVSPSGGTDAFAFAWGELGDVPVAGDFDGDGYSDFIRYNQGLWTIRKSSSPVGQEVSHHWGVAGDEPVTGDFDGDTKSDLAIFRPSDGSFHIIKSSDGNFLHIATGEPNALPLTGDFDGDGKSDGIVYRPWDGFWIWKASSGAATSPIQWGVPTDLHVPYRAPAYRGPRRGRTPAS